MFTSPLGLLALFGIPVVVGLYLFRRRTRTRKVSAVFLWDAPELSPVAGRRIERLRTEPSFWCEVLMALLLGLLAAGPRGCGSRTATHLVCILDGSASMGAIDAEGTSPSSAADRARNWIDDELDDLSARSLATIIVSGPRPSLLAGPAVSVAEARVALAKYRPEHAGHDMGSALDLARELARDGRILIATDHFKPELADERTHLVSFGRPAANVGIVHAVRERDHETGRDAVWVTVQNFSATDATRELHVTGASADASSQTLALGPMERTTVELQIETVDALVDISLDADALTIDDNVRLSPPPRRLLRLHVGVRGNWATALGLDQNGERWAELIGDAVVAARPADAHLSLGPTEGLGTNTWNWEFTENAETAWIGPFLFDRGHPLVEGVALDGTVWMGSKQAAPRGTPIISNGDRVLLAEEIRGNRRTLHANLDPLATNLTRSPDWPILLSNWSEARRAQLPGPAQTNLVQGETLNWRGLARGAHTLVSPRGNRRQVEAGERLVVDRLQEVGEYKLLDAQDSEIGRFSVRFEDPSESNLRTRIAGQQETDSNRAEVESRHDPLPTVLWTLVLGLLFLDLFVLRPRALGDVAQ